MYLIERVSVLRGIELCDPLLQVDSLLRRMVNFGQLLVTFTLFKFVFLYNISGTN